MFLFFFRYGFEWIDAFIYRPIFSIVRLYIFLHMHINCLIDNNYYHHRYGWCLFCFAISSPFPWPSFFSVSTISLLNLALLSAMLPGTTISRNYINFLNSDGDGNQFISYRYAYFIIIIIIMPWKWNDNNVWAQCFILYPCCFRMRNGYSLFRSHFISIRESSSVCLATHTHSQYQYLFIIIVILCERQISIVKLWHLKRANIFSESVGNRIVYPSIYLSVYLSNIILYA